MALDKPSSSASKLAATVATGVVGVFAALSTNAHGMGGGAHGGGVAMGHAPASGGYRGGYAGRGYVGGHYGRGYGYYGYRGPRVIIGGVYGVPYGYGPYFVPPPVYIAPPVIVRVAPPPPPAPTVVFVPVPQKQTVVPPITTAPPAPPPPHKAPLKTKAPEVCYAPVIQIHAFNSASSVDKQFPAAIPADCHAKITQINIYNDLPATSIAMATQTANGLAVKTISVAYNGHSVETGSNTLLKGCPRDVYNIAATTPSTTWDKTFPAVSDKCRTDIHNSISSADTAADQISVILKQRPHGKLEDIVTVNHTIPATGAAAMSQSAAVTGTAPQRLPGSTTAAGNQAQSGWDNPNAAGAAVTKTSASNGSSHSKLWWLLLPAGLVTAGIVALRRKGSPDNGGNNGGGNDGGGIPHITPAVDAHTATPPRETGKTDMFTAESVARASLKTFSEAERRGIISAFTDNHRDPANQVRFDQLDKGIVSTKDAVAQFNGNGLKATLKDGAGTYSDETIKSYLESLYNLNGGAGKEGKHRIAVKCSDEVYARVVEFASKAEGQPFEIIRKPATPTAAVAVETPARPGAANDAKFAPPHVMAFPPKVA